MKVLPKLTTFAIYYTISGAPIQSLLASTSPILPDAVEMGLGRVIFRKHRGTSHNLLFWFFGLAVARLPCLTQEDAVRTNQEVSFDV